MRKRFAIILLFLYVFSTTELIQLLRVPILIEHYFEHKAKSPDMSVSEFIVLHYYEDHLKNHPKDDDYVQDQRLPFMMHNSTLNVVFISPSKLTLEVTNQTYLAKEDDIPLMNELIINYIHLSSIWQPPKYS